MSEEEKVANTPEEKVDATEIPEEDVAKDDGPQTEGEPKGKPEDADSKTDEKPQEDSKKKEDDIQDRYMRLMAEYQNYRNRTTKEKQDIYAHANEDFACGLLEVIDNFERALDSKPEGDKFSEGMELILKQLQNVLSKNGVTEIESMGKAFDPNFHNAVMTEDVEGVESGTITKVFQKGYILNGKVIRPSMVGVAK